MPSPKAPSAALLAKRGAVMVWNKAAVDALKMGAADAMVEVGGKIIADAVSTMRPGRLDAPPYGEGLIASGYSSVWALGKLVSGSAEVAASKNKPRGLKVPADQVVMVAAFSAPHAHFPELGTVNEPARPFLLPAFNRNVPGAGAAIVPAMGKRVKGVPASLWSAAPRGPRAVR